MKTLHLKKLGLLAQYFLWSTTVSACLGMTHSRLIFFMLGLMILVSLSGMQLREVLNSFEKKEFKFLYVMSIAAVISLTIYAF